MRNLFKYLYVAMLVFVTSCSDYNDGRFENSNPEIGWVQMAAETDMTDATSSSFSVNVRVQVPLYESFTVGYVVNAVQGDFRDFGIPESGTLVINPTIDSRTNPILFNLENMSALRVSETIFTVELVSVDSGQAITLGGPGDENLVTTVTIPCNEPSTLQELLSLDPNFLLGDFTLATGSQSGFPAEYFPTQTVTLFQGLNPNERVFEAILFPGASFAQLVTVTIELVEDPDVGVTVIYKSNIAVGIACGGDPFVPILESYEIDVNDPNQSGISYTQITNLCSLGAISVNYYEDLNGPAEDSDTASNACGATAQFSSFTLTPQ